MTKDKQKKLKDIFENDNYDLLLNGDNKQKNTTTRSDRLIESFQEVSNFYEEFKRAPLSEGIREFSLHARLKAIRNDPLKVKKLLPFDYYNLLKGQKNKSVDITEIINVDPKGLLSDEMLDESVFQLTNIKKSNRVRPEYLARRTVCKEFLKYKDMFACIHQELKDGQRKLVEFKSADLQVGKFYILNGIVFFLEKSTTTDNNNDYESGERTRKDGRTCCIFDNGTESTMLYRSLVKALDLDGFSVSELNKEKKNASEVSDADESNGYIYILKSKSEVREIASIHDLYKIGYCTGDITSRIKNAPKEPTYLMADVSLVSAFRCFNMSTYKLEKVIHSFFDNVKLNIVVIGDDGKEHRPREWFSVPIDVIEELVNIAVNGDINNFIYNAEMKSLIMKSNT